MMIAPWSFHKRLLSAQIKKAFAKAVINKENLVKKTPFLLKTFVQSILCELFHNIYILRGP